MPPIGETLREARLRQGVEIPEVEQATKIRAKYLRALEGEEFERLPGATFVRTFLRTYAEYLGLDAQMLVEEFRAQHESPRDDDVQAVAPPPSSRPRQREARRRLTPSGGGPPRGTLVIGALVAIVGLLLLIGLLSGDGGDEDTRPAGAENRQERGQGGRNRGGNRQGGARNAAQGVELRVAPLGETYVCVVDADGQEVFEQTIAEPETFEGESLRVNFGNTQVELELNGEELPIEQASDPVALEFTPEGQEELPESERPCT